MSNYTNEAQLFITKVDRRNPKEAIVNLLNIDSDFDEVAENIADKLCKKYKKLETIVEKAVEYSHRGNEFLLSNSSYCRGFELTIMDIDENMTVLAIGYII